MSGCSAYLGITQIAFLYTNMKYIEVIHYSLKSNSATMHTASSKVTRQEHTEFCAAADLVFINKQFNQNFQLMQVLCNLTEGGKEYIIAMSNFGIH